LARRKKVSELEKEMGGVVWCLCGVCVVLAWFLCSVSVMLVWFLCGVC